MSRKSKPKPAPKPKPITLRSGMRQAEVIAIVEQLLPMAKAIAASADAADAEAEEACAKRCAEQQAREEAELAAFEARKQAELILADRACTALERAAGALERIAEQTAP